MSTLLKAANMKFISRSLTLPGNVGFATLGVQVKEKPKPKSSGVVAGDAITSMLNLINNARADAGFGSVVAGR